MATTATRKTSAHHVVLPVKGLRSLPRALGHLLRFLHHVVLVIDGLGLGVGRQGHVSHGSCGIPPRIVAVVVRTIGGSKSQEQSQKGTSEEAARRNETNRE